VILSCSVQIKWAGAYNRLWRSCGEVDKSKVWNWHGVITDANPRDIELLRKNRADCGRNLFLLCMGLFTNSLHSHRAQKMGHATSILVAASSLFPISISFTYGLLQTMVSANDEEFCRVHWWPVSAGSIEGCSLIKTQKATLISERGLYFWPATTYFFQYFRVQYNRANTIATTAASVDRRPIIL